MKILVFGDRLEVGGSQVNAIELSAGLRDLHHHEIVYYASPGPMTKLVHEKKLRYVEAPDAHRHPSPERMKALREVVRRERPGVIHAWDWWQCLDAFWAVHLAMGVPLLVTDMNMTINRVLPKQVLTTFGTPELADQARKKGRRRVDVLLPPVDVHFNCPGQVSHHAFRRTFHIDDGDTLLVTVSRFAATLKAESLRRSIRAMEELGRDSRLTLALVGDGVLRSELQQLADGVNSLLGRRAVVLTGALLDPRPAYAAADVVLGMGGSALRAMAFEKPVVVLGEAGFSDAFTPDTSEFFLYKGIYGLGDGRPDVTKLVADVRRILAHPDHAALGAFSRDFVVTHYSLEAGCQRLSELCGMAAHNRPASFTGWSDGARTAAVLIVGAFRQSLRWPPRLPPARTPQVVHD